jgi:CubicO group peptidase (beta-lactamase class C family)
MNPRSAIFRALMVNPGSGVSLDEERVYARNLEVPSGGGVGTARAMARAYSVFATGGRELGLRPETLQALTAPAIPSAHGFYDEGVKGEVEFSLGFMKTCPGWPFGHAGAFGAPGAGGSLGFADPRTGIAYAYVTNRMGAVTGDPRDVALRNAIPARPGDGDDAQSDSERRLDHDHGARGEGGDPLRVAAKHRVDQAVMPVGGHDDEVAAFLLGDGRDDLPAGAELDANGDADAVELRLEESDHLRLVRDGGLEGLRQPAEGRPR